MTDKTVKQKIITRITRSKKEVFLRKDFQDLGGYNQVGKILQILIGQNKLIKIGWGLYAKAQISPLTGKPIPRCGINKLVSEALKRLNVETTSSSYERSYNDEKTHQIPTGRVVAVKSRITRKIGYNGKYVIFEYV